MNHENGFSTTLTSNQVGGVTTTPLDAIPSVDAPYYLALDATNINGNYEIVVVTSDTATNINHAATSNAHTTEEEVRMVLPAEEVDAIQSGWSPIVGTCTYASASTFTIASIDYTTVFTKGTKIKLTNDGSVKYFYVTGSAFGANTTVTIRGEVDLADAAITAAYYSYSDCPQGFKRGQDWFRARAYLGTQQDNLVDGADTQVTLDTEDYDTNSNFAANAYTAPISGWYQISAQASFVNTVADKQYTIRVKVDAANALVNQASPSLADRCNPVISDVIKLNKGEVVTLYATSESGGDTVDIDDGSTLTHLAIQFIGI